MRLLFYIIAPFLYTQHSLGFVTDLRYEVAHSDLIKFLKSDKLDNQHIEGSLTVAGQKYSNVKLRYKGHTSRLFSKKGIAIKLPKKMTAPAAFGHLSEVSLNPMYTDKSYLREKIVWDLFDQIGGFGPRQLGYSRLFINNVDLGLYILIQPINEEFLTHNNKSGDDLFEANEGRASGNLKPAPADYLSDAYRKKNETEKSYAKLAKMIDQLNKAADNELANTAHELFDMKSVYNWFSLNALTMQGDSYSKNYFLYRDPNQQPNWQTIPWDYDISFGRDGNPQDTYPLQILNDLFSYTYPVLSGPENTLKQYILKDPRLLAEFKKRLSAVLDTVLKNNSAISQIDETALKLESFVQNDPVRWGSKSDYHEQVEAIKYFITARYNFILSQFLNTPSGLIDEATLPITNKNKIYYFVDQLGNTIAQLKFSEISGLKSIRIKAYPSQTPQGVTSPHYIKRYIEIIPTPANAKFKAELTWEYRDGVQLTEVSGGLMQDIGFQSYNLLKGIWKKLPSKANSYGNFITQNISHLNCGKGQFFVAKSPHQTTGNWSLQKTNLWHRWNNAQSITNENLIAIGDDGTVVLSTDSGNSWNSQYLGSHMQLRGLAILNNKTYIVTDQFGQIFKTTDSGKTWLIVKSPAIAELNAVIFYNEKTGWAVGSHGVVLNTQDAGDTWSKSTIDDSRLLAILLINSNEIIVSGDRGDLFKSTDSGSTWSKLFIKKNLLISRFLFVSENELWAVANLGQVLHSTDRGLTWKIKSLGANVNLYGISAGPQNSIFVAGEDGQIYSTKDKKTWKQEIIMSTNDFHSLTYNKDTGDLLVFGNSGSIFKRKSQTSF